ncbi:MULTISPECIES: class I SAM-dependent methyltransferase [unclassified Thioalkalivibrio]|uniref:class I SAM-dependent methyltransferase n=1 Tax=unclassified Thioalkalivibrio TaxID=2621013 RepID=UPI00037225C8|nr:MULTISPECIES: class I SAM-dependent methyltransferase [unclassified Thioalkalivibrio]
MTDSEFEQRWRRRFVERGAQWDDDAGIAGWTPTGLNSRVRQFQHWWRLASPPKGCWLDIGCGAGTYTRMLQVEGYQAVGLDYSPPSVQKARDRSPDGIDWLAADIHQLPLPDATADGILCFGVMQALSDPVPALAEMARVMRPGGEIWVDALNARCLPTRVQEYRRHRAGRPPHLRYDTRASLEQAARAAGLDPMALYWLPLAPGRLARLQGVLESRPTRGLLSALPPLAAGLSHSFILRARRL